LVLDADVNVQDTKEVLWAASTRIDPKRDVIILEDTPMDTLDHATPFPNLGSKIGIDATRKLKEEGFDREWPEEVKMNENIKKIVKEKFGDLFK
jgi:4-hydroxy-3-polyprenylbenzoate decarboxylase